MMWEETYELTSLYSKKYSADIFRWFLFRVSMQNLYILGWIKFISEIRYTIT